VVFQPPHQPAPALPVSAVVVESPAQAAIRPAARQGRHQLKKHKKKKRKKERKRCLNEKEIL
jgi:hypothetical protein